MSIAFDAATTDTYVGGMSRTWSHPCTGSDRFLVVCIAVYTNTAGVSGVTYAGVSMTLIGTITATGGCVVHMYALKNPASGANNVVATLSGPPWYYAFAAASYTGVDQTTPYGTYASASGGSGTPTVDVSSASGELVVDALAARMNPSSPGSGQTQRALVNNASDGANIRAAISEEAGAATTTMSWSGSGATWAIIGLPLKPAAGGGGAVKLPPQILVNQAMKRSALY